MAFEDVDILVRIGAGTHATRWRQDGAIGSLVTFSLSDTRDVRTLEWILVGRPEGSGAGGGGPEPIVLGNSLTCSITLDIPGTFIVVCVINGGSPNRTFKTAGASILCETTDPEGRPLRYLGGFETDEDLADPLVAQGWIKMLNRWLHALEAFIQGGGIDTFKVKIDAADTIPDFALYKIEGDGTTLTFEVVTAPGGKKKLVGHAQGDDHEVKATAADTGHGALNAKTKAGTGIALTDVEEAGVQKLQIACTVAPDDHLVKARNADATTVGGLHEKTINSPTVERTLTVDANGVEVISFNTIAQADPISFASTLYAAHLDDPALFSPVVCAFYKVVGGGANFVTSFHPDYTEWEEIRPGVFKSTIIGQGSIRDYIPDGITPVAGMRVASVNPTEYPMHFAYDEIRTGVYIIANPGYTGTIGEPGYSVDYAVLERAPELDASADFAAGCVFQVTQGLGAGKYFRMTNTQPIVLGTDELTWEILNSYAATASDNLLTAAQLARASETPNTTALVASLNTPSASLDFPTLAGTPNLDTYKAGRTEVWALARLHVAGESGSVTRLECQIVRDPGGDDEVLETIETSPITNTTDEIIKAHVDDPDDQDLAGDRIGLRIRAVSDSATPAAIAVTWSDPAHSTRVLTPMSLAVGGSDDHQALTPVSRGFTAEEEADSRTYRHPMRAIAPGRITWNTGPAVETVDGLLTLPAHTNAVRISGTDSLLGIATVGMTPGTVIYVEFSEARPVANNATVGTGYAGFRFHTSLGFTASPALFFAPGNAGMVLQLSGGVWGVLSVPWAEPQRALWPVIHRVTINATTASGLLELPDGCAGTVLVTGTALRGITIKDATDNATAGPGAQLKLRFLNACTLYHLDAWSGWDAELAARAAKIDMLPPAGATGTDCNIAARARNTLRFVLDTEGDSPLWIPEVGQ